MPPSLDRRTLISLATSATCGALVAGPAAAAVPAAKLPDRRTKGEPFGYSFNSSTIRGQKLPLPEVIDLAAKAGFHAIEPWMDEIHRFVEGGGNLKDLRKRIADVGLTVESAIGFANWIVDDDTARAAGFEATKRDMAALRELGGLRIAAPPAGATNQSDMNLFRIAERYRQLLELGDELDVVPQLELWGFSKTLNRLGEVVFAATESGHPKACMLPDIYHIYKGGSDFNGLRLLAGTAIHVFHFNDYPSDPPRATIKDADRIFPGDGVAPLGPVLKDLYATGFRGYLSLELFNPTYYQQDPREVVRIGLEKMRLVVRSCEF